MQVNQNVVTGFIPFDLPSFYTPFVPVYAKPSCLSIAMQTPWTNRVPLHEPWPRVMKGDTTPPPNIKNTEYKQNVHHYDQYDNHTSPDGLEPIGRIEGEEEIQRGEFWRR